MKSNPTSKPLFFSSLFLLWLGWVTCAFALGAPQSPNRRGTAVHAAGLTSFGAPTHDLLVIVLDDVGYLDVFQAYGSNAVYPSLPNLSSIAAQSWVAFNAYSSPTCEAARRALYFGIPWTTNAGPACAPPDAFTPLLAEKSVFERLPGYLCGFWGKWHLGCARGGGACELAAKTQGVDFVGSALMANINACGGNSYRFWNRWDGEHSAMSTEYQPDALRSSFLTNWGVVSSLKAGFVNTSLLHVPLHWPSGNTHLPDDPGAQYIAMRIRLDEDIGAIKNGVDLSKTTVLIVGDNGTIPTVAPNPIRAKGSCYERGVRVPLMAFGAGVTPGTSNGLVWIGDIYSTLIELGGGTIASSNPYPIASQSFAAALSGGAWTPREHAIGGTLWNIPGVEGTRYVVTDSGWKLIQWDHDGDDQVNVPASPSSLTDREELYDLLSDPNETTNLVNAMPTLAASLRATLEGEALP